MKKTCLFLSILFAFMFTTPLNANKTNNKIKSGSTIRYLSFEIGTSSSMCYGTTATVYYNSNIGDYATVDWFVNNIYSGSGSGINIVISNTKYIEARSSGGAWSSLDTTITVINNPSAPGTIIGITTVCQGQNAVTYTVPPVDFATSYIWSLKGATGTSTTNSITINYLDTAVFGHIAVWGTNICATGSVSSLNITVNPIPTTPTTSNNGPVCTGNTLSLTASTISGVTYSWTGPNGFTSISQNPIVSTNATTAMAGLYSVIATANGCSSPPDSTTVFINQAIVNSNNTVCVGDTLKLTASTIPGATYYWIGPNGFSSTLKNPIVSISTTSVMAGIYSIYTTVNGCTSPTPGTTTVVVNPLPVTPIVGNNGPVCVGNILSLTASTILGASYLWTGPNGFNSTQQNPTVSSNVTTAMGGVYSVISIENGCSSITGSTTVEINKITATSNGPVCTGNTLYLSSTSVTGASYSWTGPNGFTSTVQNPIVSTSAISNMGGVYSVTSTVNGCSSPSSITIVTINLTPTVPSVISTVTYCQNATALQLTAIGNSLLWYTTTGGIGSSIAPTPNTSIAGTTTYYVSQTSNNCESQRGSINVIVNPLPTNAGNISGSTSICSGQSSVLYTVPAISYASTYVWSFPSGVTGTSNTDSITLYYSSSAVSGNITVSGNNSCGNGGSSTLAINVNPLPANASTISGATTVCQGQSSVTYTVPTITNASSYVWTLIDGTTDSTTTNSIIVNFSSTSISGGIQVYGQNSCGNGNASIIAITVNPLSGSAGIISGVTNVCQEQNSVTYTVPTITNATTYIWTLLTGATGTSTTNSINVNYSTTAVSGDISVNGHNSCGNGTGSSLAIIVNPLPSTPGTISGTTTVCQDQNSIVYAVPTINNAATYVWTLPTDATGTSNTNIITVNYGTSAISGNITVKGNNSCGDGISANLAITVNPLPSIPLITQTGNTLHSSAVSGNQWYNVASGIISSATAQTYNPTSNGYYYTIVTLLGCSSDSSNHYHYSNVGIEENGNNNGVFIYPNPAKEILTIETSYNNEQRLEIVNLIGQTVYTSYINKKAIINTSAFSKGVYILKLSSDKETVVRKFVKE